MTRTAILLKCLPQSGVFVHDEPCRRHASERHGSPFLLVHKWRLQLWTEKEPYAVLPDSQHCFNSILHAPDGLLSLT